MLELFGFLTMLEWLVIAVAFGLLIFACEVEHYPGSVVVVASAAVAIWLLAGQPPVSVTEVWSWLNHNVIRLIELAALYVLIGGIVSFAKWYFHVEELGDRYENMRESYQNKYKDFCKGMASPPTYLAWLNERAPYGSEWPPNPAKNKARIGMWVVYWPPVAFWLVLNKPLAAAKRVMFRAMSASMHAVSKWVFANRFEEFRT